LFQDIQVTGDNAIALLMNWQQPIGAVESNFELFLVDRPQLPGSGGGVLTESSLPLSFAFSDIFDSSNDPAQGIAYGGLLDETVHLVIARQQGSVELDEPELIKWINISDTDDVGVIYEYVNDSDTASGASTIFGHANAASAITVGGARFQDTPAFGSNTITVQDLSSNGASPIFFDAQGNPLPSPEIRQKPDIIGPTDVDVSNTFFGDFFPGTEGAAAHVAGTIALMLQRAGGSGSLTADQVRDILKKTDLPVAPSPNLPTDTGFIQANDAVLQATLFEQEGSSGNDQIIGQAQSENLYGSAGNDTLRGGKGLDALFGGEGNDALFGGEGNDVLMGEAGQDTLRGGQGRDMLMGGRGRDTLRGDRGADILLGEQGRDRLVGGRGADVLNGGAGRNTLTGGSGKDTFVLDMTGRAIIQDFQVERDRLALEDGLTFDDLEIIQRGNATVIRTDDQQLATLRGLQSDQITADLLVATSDVLVV
ncbi:MAG: hypothetical protein F6K09_08435, partial [Merismopedia sp. SIO2A8]|nr:hypothetical protein [Merismopedia sp. SIO2A8]